MHLRGILSPSRIAEIHAKEDRTANAQRMEQEAHAGSAQEENLFISAGPTRTFRVPDDSSSDEESDEEIQVKDTNSRPPFVSRWSVTNPHPADPFVWPPKSWGLPQRGLGAKRNDGSWADIEPWWEREEREAWEKGIPYEPSLTEQNVFESSQQEHATPNVTNLTNESSDQAADNLSSSQFKAFEVPGGSPSDSDENDEDGSDQKEPEGLSSNEILGDKKWSQTPPPKPRPGNAQLPSHSSAELAKARAALEKHKPKQPSRLCEVTQMSSPIQPVYEKENHYNDVKNIWDESFPVFDPEVLELLNSIPDEQIAETRIPSRFSPGPLSSGVQNEVLGQHRMRGAGG